jgi:hypothetical protein
VLYAGPPLSCGLDFDVARRVDTAFNEYVAVAHDTGR